MPIEYMHDDYYHIDATEEQKKLLFLGHLDYEIINDVDMSHLCIIKYDDEKRETSNKKKIAPTKSAVEGNSKKPAKNLSSTEVREKLRLYQEKKLLKEQKMQPAQKVPNEGESFSDVQKNDPNNPVTTDKLKQVLSMGSFDFNDKERQVLDKILAGA